MRWDVTVGLAVGITAAAEAQGGDRRLRELDAYVEKTRTEWKAPAVGVAVVVRDSVVLARGYGFLESGKPARADENTLFAIGSSSKAFTTAALAMLVDEGKLRWDDRAENYLPGWRLKDPWVTREITIRDLITHRVGLDRADWIWEGTDFSRDEVLRRQRFIEPQVSFRSRFGYNNHMFLAAGRVIENVSGQRWEDFVRQRILVPLGMRRTGFSTHDLSGLGNVATPHGWLGDSVIPIPWHNIDNIAPAGSINSSAREMAEWLRLQLNAGVYRGTRMISASAMHEMHSPQTVIPLERWYQSLSPVNHQMVPGTHFFMYGMGWFLQDYKGHYLVQHGGSIDGMRALVAMAPEDSIGIVVLTNQNPSNVDEAIAFRFFDLYLGGGTRDWSRVMFDSMMAVRHRERDRIAQVDRERAKDTHPSLELSKYAGVYSDSAYPAAEIREEGGKLTVHVGVLTGTLSPWSYDTFRVDWQLPTGDWTIATFELDARARPVRLAIPGMPPLVRAR